MKPYLLCGLVLSLAFTTSFQTYAITPEQLKVRADIASAVKDCPRPFSGSDNFLAKRLNSEVVAEVGAQGKAPSKQDTQRIFKALLEAHSKKQIQNPDMGFPDGEKYIRALAAGKKPPSPQPFRVDVKAWGDFAVLWFRAPSEPAVHLLVRNGSEWSYVCVTEFVYN